MSGLMTRAYLALPRGAPWMAFRPARASTLLGTSRFPRSLKELQVRVMETCTDPLADSPWVEWSLPQSRKPRSFIRSHDPMRNLRPTFIQTWPEPAQAPSNFTFEITAYNVPLGAHLELIFA